MKKGQGYMNEGAPKVGGNYRTVITLLVPVVQSQKLLLQHLRM